MAIVNKEHVIETINEDTHHHYSVYIVFGLVVLVVVTIWYNIATKPATEIPVEAL
jgi:hypothetical protein